MDTNDPWNTAMPTLQTLILSANDDALAEKIYNILSCGRGILTEEAIMTQEHLEVLRMRKIDANEPPLMYAYSRPTFEFKPIQVPNG